MEKRESKFNKFWKKFWFIVWKDNSFKGWIISIIFLFLIIKLVFFPLINLATGTSLPLVIVESCSMHHEDTIFGDFNSWWSRHEMKYFKFVINENKFEQFTMKKGFTKGDILFVTGVKPENIKIGDIIIFQTTYPTPIIHRVMKIYNINNETIYSTMGDNNNGQLDVEKEIHANQIIGKARFQLMPYAGWVKLIFFEPFRLEQERGTCTEN
jgi:signal peptidase I